MKCIIGLVFILFSGCMSSHLKYKWKRVPIHDMVKKYSCENSADGTNLFPHPTDNTKYVVCNSGWKFYMYCPRGTKFDAKRKICMYKSKIRYYPLLDAAIESPTDKIEENEITGSRVDVVGTNEKEELTPEIEAVVPEPIAMIPEVEKETPSEDDSEDFDYSDNLKLCSTLAREGYSCVPKNQCKRSGSVLVDIRGIMVVRTRREAKEHLICEDTSQTCCYQEDLIPLNEAKIPEVQMVEEEIFLPPIEQEAMIPEVEKETPPDDSDYYGDEDTPCSTLARDGYSCVPNDQCEGDGLLDVRGAGGKTCEDTAQICCHKTLLKVPEAEKETPPDYSDYYGDEDIPCSTLARDGYSCVPNDQCEGDGLLDVRGAGEHTCEDTAQICCHKTSLKVPEAEKETPPDYSDYYGDEDIPCSTLARDGYSCVPNDQCDDDGLLDVRGAGEYTCEDTAQICCHKTSLKVPENEQETRPEDSDSYDDEDIPKEKLTEEYDDYYDQTLCSTLAREGYRCVPNDQCDSLLDKRGDFDGILGGGQQDLTCEDNSQTCCPDSQIKEALRNIFVLLGKQGNELATEDDTKTASEPVTTATTLTTTAASTTQSTPAAPSETISGSNDDYDEVKDPDDGDDYGYDYAYNYDEYSDEEDVDCSNYGNALKEIEDLEKKKCSEFAGDGFRCVPFYACKDGDVVTNGVGILSERSDAVGGTFNPLDSKCDDFKEICCRLPEWKDVPLEEEIKLPDRPPVKCIQELRKY